MPRLTDDVGVSAETLAAIPPDRRGLVILSRCCPCGRSRPAGIDECWCKWVSEPLPFDGVAHEPETRQRLHRRHCRRTVPAASVTMPLPSEGE